MKAEIQTSIRYLHAALICAAEQDIRYYLNGVLVEISESGVRYVATDGHRCLCLRDDTASGPIAQIIVPREIVSRLPHRYANPSTGPMLTYDTDNLKGECRIGDLMFKPVDGKFPDYRKVIPETATKEWAQIQVRYMVSFLDAANAAFGNNPPVEFWPNGPEKVCLVTCGREEFAGAVMPIRAGCDPEFAQWVQRDEAIAA